MGASQVNVVVVEGNVGSDPKMKYDGNGIARAAFDIINHGENIEQTWTIRVGGKLAEICSVYLKIGSKIIVSGKLRATKTRCYIVASDVKFCPAKKARS